jgi:hypothetical protein
MNKPHSRSVAFLLIGALLIPLWSSHAQSTSFASLLDKVPVIHYKFRISDSGSCDDGQSVRNRSKLGRLFGKNGNEGGTSRGRTQTFSSLLSGDAGESVDLSVEIAVADFSIEPAGGDTMIYISVEYDPDIYSFPEVSQSRKEGGSAISLHSEFVGDDPDLEHKTGRNVWKVRIGSQFIWSLDLDLAYTETNLELGGLKIEDLNVNSGFSDTMLKFSLPASSDMKKLIVDTGLGSFRTKNLGNARIVHMSVDNGLGSAVLDYGQALLRDTRVQVESGLGSVKFRLPERLPVEMEVETSMGSADLPHFDEIRDGFYRSIGYMTGNPALNADVSVGLGSVTVIWITADDTTDQDDSK